MVVGIRVGTNVIPFFRPVLFYRTNWEASFYSWAIHIWLWYCDSSLSVCLTTCYCLTFRCVWPSWAYTPCQTWHLVYTVTGLLLGNPSALMEMNGSQQAEADSSLCSHYWGPRYLHCRNCAHSRSALFISTGRGICTVISTGESHYCPHAWLWKKIKTTFSFFLILNFGQFLDKILIFVKLDGSKNSSADGGADSQQHRDKRAVEGT